MMKKNLAILVEVERPGQIQEEALAVDSEIEEYLQNQ